MRNKETGEFELVVGNGVLLSGFFIVVLLFAVAFAMGFIVARAKYQQDPQGVAAATSTVPLSPPVTSSRPTDSAMPPAESSRPAADPQTQPPATTPVTTTVAQTPAPASEAPTPANTDSNAVVEAPTGHYWQVTSTADIQAARVYLQTIKDMGLPVTLSPGPNKLTRVLVGPFPDSAALAKAKTQLNNAGMQTVRHDQQ